MGFIPNIGIEEAKLSVYKELQNKQNSNNRGDNPAAIFIDFSNAYDKVKR